MRCGDGTLSQAIAEVSPGGDGGPVGSHGHGSGGNGATMPRPEKQRWGKHRTGRGGRRIKGSRRCLLPTYPERIVNDWTSWEELKKDAGHQCAAARKEKKGKKKKNGQERRLLGERDEKEEEECRA